MVAEDSSPRQQSPLSLSRSLKFHQSSPKLVELNPISFFCVVIPCISGFNFAAGESIRCVVSGALLKLPCLLVQEQPNLGTKLAAEAAAVSHGGEWGWVCKE